MNSMRRLNQHHLFISALIVFFFLAMSHCAQDSTSGGGQNNNGSNGDNGDAWIPMVNLQITENANVDAFNTVLAELESRSITATIIVDEFMATTGCSSLQSADLYGHEVMIYGRPDEPGDDIIILEMLDYAEQEAVITDAKSAVENCLGKSTFGFRSYRWSQNVDTYEIVDSLGIEYNLSFVAHTYRSLPGHTDDVLPYKEAPYNFWAVPMHSVELNQVRNAFCDMPFAYLSPVEYEDLLKNEFENMATEKRPLLVEVHPYFSVIDPERFNAVINFLDYAVSRGAEFITIEELVDWSRQNSP